MHRLTAFLAFLGLLALPFVAWGQSNEVIRISDGDHGTFTCSSGDCQLDAEDSCAQVVYAVLDPTEAGGTDDFASWSDHSASTTEANEDDFYFPLGVSTIHSLQCVIDTAPGAGQDAWRITVRDDGSDTGVTCDIDETATNCTDSSNTVAPSIRSKMNFDISSEVSGDADPTAAGELFCSVCIGH